MRLTNSTKEARETHFSAIGSRKTKVRFGSLFHLILGTGDWILGVLMIAGTPLIFDQDEATDSSE